MKNLWDTCLVSFRHNILNCTFVVITGQTVTRDMVREVEENKENYVQPSHVQQIYAEGPPPPNGVSVSKTNARIPTLTRNLEHGRPFSSLGKVA